MKRWRDNYYLSQVLAYFHEAAALRFRPGRAAYRTTSAQEQRHDGLPNGKSLSIGRDSGIGIASLLFWHGLDGFRA